MTPFGSPPHFRLEVEVEPPLALDPDTGGPLRLVRITGGRVSGQLAGLILRGGADWQTIRPDGATEIEARYLLKVTSGESIEVKSHGLRSAGAVAFWSNIWLRTASPALAHLNTTQFLGLGRKQESCVAIEVFALPEAC